MWSFSLNSDDRRRLNKHEQSVKGGYFLRKADADGSSEIATRDNAHFLQGAAKIHWANQDFNDGRISKDEYHRRVSEGLTEPLPGSSDLKYWFGIGYSDLLEPIVESLTPTIPPPQEIGTTEKWFESHPPPSGPTFIGPVPDDNQTFIAPADPPVQYQDFADPGATQWYGW